MSGLSMFILSMPVFYLMDVGCSFGCSLAAGGSDPWQYEGIGKALCFCTQSMRAQRPLATEILDHPKKQPTPDGVKLLLTSSFLNPKLPIQ